PFTSSSVSVAAAPKTGKLSGPRSRLACAAGTLSGGRRRWRRPAVLLSAGGGDSGADSGERGVGGLAEDGDGADAHDDDQGEHDGVLDRGRAVFRLQELDDALGELTHGSLLGFRGGGPQRPGPAARRCA